MNGEPRNRTNDNPSQNAQNTGNTKTNEEGAADHTLLGDSTTHKFNDTTGFVSAGNIVTSDYDHPPEDTALGPDLFPSDEQYHSIISILTRPVKIATLTFSTSSTPGYQLQQDGFDVMEVLRTNAGFRQFREKLSGFYAMHCSAKLRITLNPQPFEAGMFQIYFVPFARSMGTIESTDNGEYLLPFSTGCPNVLVNVSIQSEVSITVPYTGPTAFINLTNANSDFGTFYVQSISPLVNSTNAASCELSVYLNLENVKLFGASPRTWTLQAPGISEMCEADAKTTGMNAVKRSGILSSQGDKLKNTVDKVGDKVLDVLDSLGLSAPLANPNHIRMNIGPYSSPANVDTTQTAHKTSMMFKHHLDTGTLGIDKNDEMNLTYIATKPGYYNQFSWDINTEAQTQLYSYPVEPNCALFRSYGQNVLAYPNRLRYVANCFRYWRGTMRYIFHIVANKFHSGRLRVVYSLGGGIPTDRLTELYPYSFSQIIDIRDATTFTVDCPYFASTPYKAIPQDYDPDNRMYTQYSPDTSGTFSDITPQLQIFVENELRASDSTTTTIQIVCFTCATEDFEFSTAISPYSQPVEDFVAPSVMLRSPLVTLQGADTIPINMVSGYNKIPEPSDPSRFTTGETVTSVRQMLKRYYLLGQGNLFPNAQNSRDLKIFPYAFRKPDSATSVSGEYLHYFFPLYRFYRGSIRYLFRSTDPFLSYTFRYDPSGIDLDLLAIDETPEFGSQTPVRSIEAYASGDFSTQFLTANIPYHTPLQGGAEIEFPYYSRFHKLGTQYLTDDQLVSYQSRFETGLVPVGQAAMQVTTASSSTATQLQVYRAAADDFTLGYLLGPPPVIVDSQTSSSTSS